MARKVAIVSGSNKGIGFAIVRGLCKQFDGDVFLTARSEDRGRQAVADLEKAGLKALFHQLDIEDKQSIKTFADFISKTYGGLDILINNAGMAFKQSATESFSEQAEVTMRTNYFGTLAVCEAFFPLLRPGARVVQVSSFTSIMAMQKMSPQKRQEMSTCQTVEDVTRLMNQFVVDAKAGNHDKAGWANSAYGTTKLGITAMTPVQQTAFTSDTSRLDIVVNAICPGYVDTDMSSHRGTKTPDQGADTPLYAAFLPAGTTIRGQFISDRTVSEWKAVL